MTNRNDEIKPNYLYCILDNTHINLNPGWDVEIFIDNANSRLAFRTSNFDIKDIELREYLVEKESLYGLDSKEKALAALENMKEFKKLSNIYDLQPASLKLENTTMKGVPLPNDEIMNGTSIQLEVDSVTGIVYNLLQANKESEKGSGEGLSSVGAYNSIEGLTSIGGIYVYPLRVILRFIDEKYSGDIPGMKVGHYYIADNINDQLADIYTLDFEWIGTFCTGRFEAVTSKELLETYPEAAKNHPHLFDSVEPYITYVEISNFNVIEDVEHENHDYSGKGKYNNPFSRMGLEERDWIASKIEHRDWTYAGLGIEGERKVLTLLDSEQKGWDEVERLSLALTEAQQENELIRKLTDGSELGEALAELHEFYRLRYTDKQNECLDLLASTRNELEYLKLKYEKPYLNVPVQEESESEPCSSIGDCDSLDRRRTDNDTWANSTSQSSVTGNETFKNLLGIVQAMHNAELNAELALSLGHTIVYHGDQCILRVDDSTDTWAPCSDPVSSQQAEKRVLQHNELYFEILGEIIRSPYKAYSPAWVAALFQATLRQRAEAAWITLQYI